MGWSRGPELAEKLWGVTRKYIAGEHRKRIARKFIDLFQDYDADDFHEAKLLLRDAQLEEE